VRANHSVIEDFGMASHLFSALLLTCASAHGLQINAVGGGLIPLAAQQLRRYLYALDRRVAPLSIVAEPVDAATSTIRLAVANDCPPGAAYIVSRASASATALLACDTLGRGALFAVTDLLTAMGLFFTAEGPPFLPASARANAVAARSSPGRDAACARALTERVMAAVASLRAVATPAFEYRGFQPWGSYPIGNDWWDRDEYRRVVELVVGLKGNWMGMHSYPCGYAYPEPGVWVDSAGGQGANILPSGNLTPAAGAAPQCAASWAATLRPSWGLRAINTSSLKFGASLLFERDCFTNRELTAEGVCGVPTDGVANEAAHNAVGALYKNVFSFAARLGVSTALGAEMPLTSAEPLRLRTYWSHGRSDTFVTPTECAECPAPGDPEAYELLNTTADAYLLSASGDGLLPLDCYWRATGTDAWLGVFNSTPPPQVGEYAFVRREGYALAQPGGAASPTVPLFQYVRHNFSKPGGTDTWLVVGDAGAATAEARGYAPLGGMRAPVAHALRSPPADAALAAYTDTFTRMERLYGKNLTWYWAWSPEGWQWGKIKQGADAVVAAVAQFPAMAAAAVAANASFGIALGGWTLGPLDNQSLFDSVAPPEWPMASLDGFLGTAPPETAFSTMSHARPKWAFPWAEDDNDLTAVQLWVGRNLAHAAAASALGITGHGSLQWRTRTVSPALTAVSNYAWNTSVAPGDFLSAYAAAAFGGGAAGDALGALLNSVDSEDMPRPVHCDPGCMAPSIAFCGAEGEAPYAFVDAWLEQRGAVAAVDDPAALERFDYWSAHFYQLRAMARSQCGWGTYVAALREVEAAPAGSAQQRALAKSLGFPAFAAMVANFSQLVWGLQGAAATYGDLGVLFQLYGDVHDAAGDSALASLEGLAGAACGPPCALPEGYAPTAGSPVPRLRAFSVRTILERGEPLNVRVHAVGDAGCGGVGTACAAFVRTAGGGGDFARVPLPQEGARRAVFYAPVSAPAGAEDAGLEWYASCTCEGGGAPLVFPPGAPAQPATVVFI
jgi:hypothetical protein